tara:strand:+ start:320 stop:502 length:183 start_codon:yes stop_codon:yes gene_type:complete
MNIINDIKGKIKTLLKTIPIIIMAIVIIIFIMGLVLGGFGELFVFLGVVLSGLGFVGGIF